MKPQSDFGQAGRALWRSVTAAMTDGWELDERDEAILSLAARQADDLALIEAAISRDGAVTLGSRGQPVLNHALGEARQARLAISRLLGMLPIPADDEQPRTEAGRRAQRAARTRWDRKPGVQRRRIDAPTS
jgi:hypothetical protein